MIFVSLPTTITMKKYLSYICIILFSFLLSTTTNGQEYRVTGTVINSTSEEPLPGATVLYGTGLGTTTDNRGYYSIVLKPGKYTLTASFVGYEEEQRSITISDKDITVNFSLTGRTLSKLNVVADVAVRRETPVAFSTIPPERISEQLASQDIPMILNSTPGVYATQQGGGDGDARINIRGFNQRNIAVLIDGIPVNDMENGWVYWSNWFGLDMVTRSIQVQRGLGASKLAIPSIGGTMNIISKGIESKPSTSIKYENGNDGFMRTSIGYNSGKLNNGWGITAAGSYKRGNGYADMTWTNGWFYFLRIDKELGNHLISFTGMGAPQQHGQRSYKSAIAQYSAEYAEKAGISPDEYIPGMPVNMGYRYNPNWGYLKRDGSWEKLNEKLNYYHKPQFSLRDYWSAGDNLLISNIAYLSVGNGGGTGMRVTPNLITEGVDEGQIDFQAIYDNNIANLNTSNDGKGGYIYSSRNNHFWYGLISSINYDPKNNWKFSGGIDLRNYKGEHYREVYDLLGMGFMNDLQSEGKLNNHTDSSIIRKKGDKIYYHNDGLVRWGGLFGLIQYETGNWNFFLNISGSYTGYNRIDYFLKRDIVVGDEIFHQAVGYTPSFQLPQGWTIFEDTLIYEGKSYTVHSPEARPAETGWNWFAGYTFKGGANYNISETMNAYINLGYLNKAPRFSNVYNNYNDTFNFIENEIVKAFEAGYNFYNETFTLNLNAYYTKWKNRPADFIPTVRIDDVPHNIIISGLDALHKGIEMELGIRMLPGLISETVVSLGDWRWDSKDTARIEDQNTGEIVQRREFDATGLYVGDAAQYQIRQALRYEWQKKLYVNGAITYFGKHYSNFEPLDYLPGVNSWAFDNDGNPILSWKIPHYYIVDLHAGYKFFFKDTRIDFRFSILNLLDAKYISDAQNNDNYTGQAWDDFDAKSAAVFFGLGRRFNLSWSISF